MSTARNRPTVFRCSNCSSAAQFTIVQATITGRAFQQLQAGKWKKIFSSHNKFTVPLAAVCESCGEINRVPYGLNTGNPRV